MKRVGIYNNYISNITSLFLATTKSDANIPPELNKVDLVIIDNDGLGSHCVLLEAACQTHHLLCDTLLVPTVTLVGCLC